MAVLGHWFGVTGLTYGKEIPTFDTWFNGVFWKEWVLGRNNKPGERESKRSIYNNHLKAAFGSRYIDEIDDSMITSFRAELQTKVKEKTVNNVLAVLSKALRFAERKRVIAHAPEAGFLRLEPPLFHVWSFEEYDQLLDAAAAQGATWYAAVCLACEAGLRVGEIKALRWERDIDMVGRTVTVNEQVRKGITGTPKGRTRRTVPMTGTLYEALRGINRIRRGFVICNDDGTAKSDRQCQKAFYRACREAGLEERGWHTCRHTFATDAARFSVNPFSLMSWLGHKSMTETLGYIAFAKDHSRPLTPEFLAAAAGETDPDRKVVAMLGARRHGKMTANEKFDVTA